MSAFHPEKITPKSTIMFARIKTMPDGYVITFLSSVRPTCGKSIVLSVLMGMRGILCCNIKISRLMPLNI